MHHRACRLAACDLLGILSAFGSVLSSGVLGRTGSTHGGVAAPIDAPVEKLCRLGGSEMKPSKALKALALAALLSIASTAALANNDPSSGDDSRQRQRQKQEQHQSAVPGVIDEIPGSQSDSTSSSSQTTDGNSQSQEQSQTQSQCMICLP